MYTTLVFSSENLLLQFIGEGAGLCNLTLSPCEGHVGPREEVSVEYKIVWMEKVRTWCYVLHTYIHTCELIYSPSLPVWGYVCEWVCWWKWCMNCDLHTYVCAYACMCDVYSKYTLYLSAFNCLPLQCTPGTHAPCDSNLLC